MNCNPNIISTPEMEISLDNIIRTIFTNPLQPKYTYTIEFEENPNQRGESSERTEYIFKQLKYILRKGLSYLFPHFYVNNILQFHRFTIKEFTIIQKYFNSFGFQLHYKIKQYRSSIPLNNEINESLINDLLDDSDDLPPLILESDNKEEKIKTLLDYSYDMVDETRNIHCQISFSYL
jgi:hypothetical protein